ncbi:Uncharacterised protein [Streptococcus pneumoniae]|nr:Uncharacterised protein [Streptococcus pneumoniae]
MAIPIGLALITVNRPVTAVLIVVKTAGIPDSNPETVENALNAKNAEPRAVTILPMILPRPSPKIPLKTPFIPPKIRIGICFRIFPIIGIRFPKRNVDVVSIKACSAG